MTNLRALVLYNTGFKAIDVENLLNLAYLDIARTYIEKLEISCLQLLEKLWMYGAPIRSISKSELQLESLRIIDLSGTKIVKLNLRGCPVLKTVYGTNKRGREVLTVGNIDLR